MAEDFYNNFITVRKRRKRRTICIFPIFHCLQIWSEFRFLRHPAHFQKGPKTQKRRLQLKFATNFSQISHRVASPCGTHVVIFSKPPKNILPPFLFLLQLYRVAIVPSLPYSWEISFGLFLTTVLLNKRNYTTFLISVYVTSAEATLAR
jgi:hypothetical protein